MVIIPILGILVILFHVSCVCVHMSVVVVDAVTKLYLILFCDWIMFGFVFYAKSTSYI